MNKNHELITRSYELPRPFECRDGENGLKIIEGLPIVYGQKTDLVECYEVILPGALDHADLTDVRLLVNHDVSRIPLARSRRNNERSTMLLKPVEEGLRMRASIDVGNNADARSLYSAVSRGDLSGMSFMFSVTGEEWVGLDTEKPTRNITAIGSVVELSAATFPAYPTTKIFARDQRALENVRRMVETARTKRAKPVETGLLTELKKIYLRGSERI